LSAQEQTESAQQNKGTQAVLYVRSSVAGTNVYVNGVYKGFAPLTLEDDKERALAIKLLQFEESVQTVGKEGTPHVLCAYLYELAGIFSSFYEHCPILNAEDESVKLSRLKLALLTEKTLKQGLELLGIKTVEKM